MSTGKPRLLDLFCCAGGAAMGYHRAGFRVVGVDLKPQPHYPFEFHQADALTYPFDGFDAVHASPPCQAHSVISKNLGYASRHADLLPQTRERLRASGLPWIMENVNGAPMPAAIVLCGSMFGLGIPELGWYIQRHRQFESSHLLFAPRPCAHAGIAISVVGTGTPKPILDKIGRAFTLREARRLMGIDWMPRAELSQTIPPVYTEWLGRQLLAAMIAEKAA